MGREVRRVPADWHHPKGKDGRYIPLHDGSFSEELRKWNYANAKWQEGFREDFSNDGQWNPLDDEEKGLSFSEWSGDQPKSEEYMPDWPAEKRTHFQMYEDTTEGTPISPVMATPEELAQWLVDNKASAFASQTASYEGWLRICRGGYAPSAVLDSNGLHTGVDGLK